MVSSKKPSNEKNPKSDAPVVRKTRSSGSKSRKPSKWISLKKKEPEVHEISESSSTGSVEEVRVHESKKSNGVVTSKGRNGKGVARPAKRRKNGGEGFSGGVVDAEIRFPMNRIRRIMREENSTPQIMQDAVFLVNKATEMFIARLSGEVYESSVQDKKKFIHYKHISSVVSNDERYEFLADSVPEKLKAEVATEEWEKAMAEGG